MNVIPGLDITPAMLVSSTVPEPDVSQGEIEFVSGTFALGAKRIIAALHKKYECILAGTHTIAPNLDPLNWELIGSTNRYAMFDKLRNSQTIAASPLVVEIDPGQRINAWALVNVLADALNVQLSVAAVPVYSATESLTLRYTRTASDYRFGSFSYKSKIARFDVPLITSGRIKITLTKASGQVRCGTLMLGKYVYVGKVLAGTGLDDLNFSKIERDQFSNLVTLIPIPSVPNTSQTILVDAANVDSLVNLKNRLNAVPAFWSGLGSNFSHAYSQSLSILGIYRKFRFSLDDAKRTILSLDLEEI